MSQDLNAPVTTGRIDPGAHLFMTPSERAVAETVAAAVLKGEDPFGDENTSVYTDAELRAMGIEPKHPTSPAPAAATTVTEPAPAPIADPLATTPVAAPVEAPVAAPAAAAEAPVAAPVEAPAVAAPAPVAEPIDMEDPTGLAKFVAVQLPSVPSIDESGYAAAKTDLRAKIADIDQQFEDGKITSVEARNKAQGPLQEQLENMNMEHAAAIGDQRATRRMVQQLVAPVIDQIKRAGERDGLKYGVDDKGQLLPHSRQYDAALDALSADPANASVSWVEKSRRADLAVRSMNGIKVGTPAPVAAPAPGAAPATTPVAATPAARATPTAPPVTLRDMPSAGRATEQGETLSAKLAVGNAQQRDAIYNNLTAAQRKQLLDD